ncbi:DUF4142 domain-containing protein [Sphaerimonospora sp. CA-214678]|uniref:DUF4142 domain-containing protein n=1 Tax=Sphaerimonospora sp. CA-214678 TaxID=3240029 RepID=UPI003D8FA783
MVRRLAILPTIAAATFATAAAGFAAAPPDLNEQDREFVTALHQGNLAEIQAGKVAERQAHSEEVREMGETLIRDHRKLDGKVKQVAGAVGVSLPGGPGAKQQAELERISAKSGAEFDRAWVEAEIAEHRQDLAAGAKQLSEGSSEQVKQLARDAEPIVREHLEDLEEIRSDEEDQSD